MEKADNIFVLPLDITWFDVGSVDAFLKLRSTNTDLGDKVVTYNAPGNLVDVKDKLVVLIGVSDLCIVDTEDVLLVVRKDESQAVKNVLHSLKKAQKFDYL